MPNPLASAVAAALAMTLSAPALAQTFVSGPVRGVWTPAGNPYVLIGDVMVGASDVLVLEPGVEVLGAAGTRLDVLTDGQLVARGTPTQRVVMSALDPAAGWRGVRLSRASNQSHLQHCLIERAVARGEFFEVRGGALAIVGCAPLVEDCELRYSSAHNPNRNGTGGGLHLEGAGGTYRRNHVHHNSADSGGGVATSGPPGDAFFQDNLVTDNEALHSGGGFYLGAWTTPVLEGNRILRNRALGTAGGGGVTSWGAQSGPRSIELRNNVIAFNSATAYAGGIFMRYDRCHSSNDLVAFNRAPLGAGIYVLNQGTQAPVIRGALVWGNIGAQIERWATMPVALSVSHSLVEGGWPGSGNVDLDPRFLDVLGPDGVAQTDDADFRLAAGSPCIDAGTNAALPPGSLDGNGEPRFVDDPCVIGAGAGPLVDIGPFERQSSSCCIDPMRECIAAANSAGPGATMGWLGSTSLAAGDLVLATTACPPHQLARYVYGLGAAVTPIALGNGHLCAPLPVQRVGPYVVCDAHGRATLALDANTVLSPGPGGVLNGQTVSFQLWYRDPAGGGALTNVSDSLAVTFCP